MHTTRLNAAIRQHVDTSEVLVAALAFVALLFYPTDRVFTDRIGFAIVRWLIAAALAALALGWRPRTRHYMGDAILGFTVIGFVVEQFEAELGGMARAFWTLIDL